MAPAPTTAVVVRCHDPTDAALARIGAWARSLDGSGVALVVSVDQTTQGSSRRRARRGRSRGPARRVAAALGGLGRVHVYDERALVAAYPRLVKMPQNGIAASKADRAPFGNAIAFFEGLRQRPCFAKFVERDLAIWGSGPAPTFLRATAPKFGLVWFGAGLPWWLFVLAGLAAAGRQGPTLATEATQRAVV